MGCTRGSKFRERLCKSRSTGKYDERKNGCDGFNKAEQVKTNSWYVLYLFSIFINFSIGGSGGGAKASPPLCPNVFHCPAFSVEIL